MHSWAFTVLPAIGWWTLFVDRQLYVGTPLLPCVCAGTAIALGGVFLYSQVKRLSGKKPKAA